MRGARGEYEAMWMEMEPRERSSEAVARRMLAAPNSELVRRRILGLCFELGAGGSICSCLILQSLVYCKKLKPEYK